MRIAIVGSREYPQCDRVWAFVEKLARERPDTIIVSGGAQGPDTVAAVAGRWYGLTVEEIKPNWEEFGLEAGFERNVRIVARADRIVAFWDGKSGGTKDTIECAQETGKKVLVLLPR